MVKTSEISVVVQGELHIRAHGPAWRAYGSRFRFTTVKCLIAQSEGKKNPGQ